MTAEAMQDHKEATLHALLETQAVAELLDEWLSHKEILTLSYQEVNRVVQAASVLRRGLAAVMKHYDADGWR